MKKTWWILPAISGAVALLGVILAMNNRVETAYMCGHLDGYIQAMKDLDVTPVTQGIKDCGRYKP